MTVSSQGSAVLGLGDSRVRLAGGSAVHLDRVDAAGITVAQLAGRAYYRVITAAHAPFAVTTGPVTWTATGTAFDTDREPVATGQGSGQERVTLLAIQDAVAASGPGFDTSVPQGERAVVYIGAATPTVAPALDAIPASALADPWLQANGAADLAAGLPLGVLDGHLQVALASPTASPSPSPFVTPSILPTDTPFPTALDTPSPTPTTGPTARGRRGPRPPRPPRRRVRARLRRRIGSLAADRHVMHRRCRARLVGQFPSSAGFARYVTLRAPSGESLPAVYPPKLGYIMVVANTTDQQRPVRGGYGRPGEPYLRIAPWSWALTTRCWRPAATSGAGGAGQPETLVLDSPNRTLRPNTSFTWTPFVRYGACFSEYEVFDTTTHRIFATLLGSQSTTGFDGPKQDLHRPDGRTAGVIGTQRSGGPVVDRAERADHLLTAPPSIVLPAPRSSGTVAR